MSKSASVIKERAAGFQVGIQWYLAHKQQQRRSPVVGGATLHARSQRTWAWVPAYRGAGAVGEGPALAARGTREGAMKLVQAAVDNTAEECRAETTKAEAEGWRRPPAAPAARLSARR